MKKIFSICLVLLVFLFISSCVKTNNFITGEVLSDIDKIGNTQHKSENEQNYGSDESVKEQETGTQPENQNNSFNEPLDFVRFFGGHVLEEAPSTKDYAVQFVEAIISNDTVVLAELLDGDAENYSELSAEISDYSIVPLGFTDEQLQAFSSAGTPVIYDQYIVKLVVESFDKSSINFHLFGDGNGKEKFYLLSAATDQGVSSAVIYGFVPLNSPEKLDKSLVLCPIEKTKLERFIHEFVSLCPDLLENGKNYASDFDFSDKKHFITHIYGEYPPLSENQINTFIKKTFLGNRGVDTSKLIEVWIWSLLEISDYSALYDDKDIKAYGCSYAHGGTTIEHAIISSGGEKDSFWVQVQTFADWAHIIPCSNYVFYFEGTEEEPTLIMVDVSIINDCTPASFSI